MIGLQRGAEPVGWHPLAAKKQCLHPGLPQGCRPRAGVTGIPQGLPRKPFMARPYFWNNTRWRRCPQCSIVKEYNAQSVNYRHKVFQLMNGRFHLMVHHRDADRQEHPDHHRRPVLQTTAV